VGRARQPLEFLLHLLEGGDPVGQLGAVPLDQPGHSAWQLAAVADSEDLADLPSDRPIDWAARMKPSRITASGC